MREYVFVKKGLEEEFIQQAKKELYDELVLIYSEEDIDKINFEEIKNLEKTFKINLKTALDVKNQKNTQKQLFDEYLQLGTMKDVLFKGITIIYNNETEPKKDFIHQRRSGLNHVILQECKKKNIKVLISYGELQTTNKSQKAKLIGRIKQNIKQSKKYGVNYEIASLARDKNKIRNSKDVKALQRILEQTNQ